MADALVSTVLEQLTSIIAREIEQELRLVVGVKNEVRKLTSNLRAIQNVLADAEERQFKDAAVKHWLDQLKNISYDMDDVLDQWSTAILKSQIHGNNEYDVQRKKWKVCSFIGSSCFRCREVGLRHDIAHKIKEIQERVDDVAKEKDDYNFNLEKGSKQIERRITASIIDVAEVKGRGREKTDLVNMLLSESSQGPNLHAISIVGMGGIGKTTLAQLVFNDHKVEKFFPLRKWICVSEPFDEIKVASAILESLKGSAPNMAELESLLQSIRQWVQGNKFLFVLDDVWEEDPKKWKQLNDSLKSCLPGSKILVTTRKDKVARVMGCTNIFRLGQLSKEESWLLFSQFAFFEKTSAELESLEDIGRKIVDKCKGLPLAVKTLGSLLRFKRLREEWQSVLDSNLWEIEDTERDIMAPLQLSYYDLPSEMKQCFLYCAVFPKDYVIEKEKLIILWMAQGYLRERRSIEMEMIGQECFENLAARSFFQDFEKDENGSIIRCKMHDMVHDLAQFVRENECLSLNVNNSEETSIDSPLSEARHLMMTLAKEASFPASLYGLTKLRTLLIEPESNSKLEEMLRGMKFDSESQSMLEGILRSLKSQSILGGILPNLFAKFTCLRALRLRDLSIKEVAGDIGKLIHLRHLDLSHNHDLKELPEEISELYNLQTLDLRSCKSLEKLPLGLGRLVNLRHLKNLDTRKLTFMPKGVDRWGALRILDEFVVSGGGHDGSASSVGDLENFNQLREQLEIRGLGNIKDVGEAKKAGLKRKKHLISLILSFDFCSMEAEETVVHDGEVIEALESPPNLKSVGINGYRGVVFPNWLMSLTNLKSVCLSNCANCERLPTLGKLKLLEYLEIRSMKGVKHVGDEFLGIEADGTAKKDEREGSSSFVAFPKLKELKFSHMEEWEEWDVGRRNADEDISPRVTLMPNLHTFDIEYCPKLKALPDQLLQMTLLNDLRMCGCSILRERYIRHDEERSKISHIKKIIIDSARVTSINHQGWSAVPCSAPFVIPLAGKYYSIGINRFGEYRIDGEMNSTE